VSRRRRRLASQLVAHWRRALAVADEASEDAFRAKALDSAELREAHRRIGAEREWVTRFERDASVLFP